MKPCLTPPPGCPLPARIHIMSAVMLAQLCTLYVNRMACCRSSCGGAITGRVEQAVRRPGALRGRVYIKALAGHREVHEASRRICGRATAERQGLRGPVTRGVLLVGSLDPCAVDAVWGPSAISALGVGEAAHWAAACHLCPPPRRRRGLQRLRTASPIGNALQTELSQTPK